MIDLTRSSQPSPLLHRVSADPGTSWLKDDHIAIEAPPDGTCPEPNAEWDPNAVRTGVFGAVTPRVLRFLDRTYRLYYTQMVPRAGHPDGALDYDQASTRILSAISKDGIVWIPEPGIRLGSKEGGAGEFRVVLTEVVPTIDGRLRMYYECAPGPQTEPSSIRSAVSDDGLAWHTEPGVRFGGYDRNYASARIIFLEDGRCRLYLLERGSGIISAISEDQGHTFKREPGIRIDQKGPHDQSVAFAPEVIHLDENEWIMYYAGYADSSRAYILRATSRDGLNWTKAADPVISPGGTWDGAKCSEVCIVPVNTHEDQPPTYRMLYEACDGTARDARGVWRILGATSKT